MERVSLYLAFLVSSLGTKILMFVCFLEMFFYFRFLYGREKRIHICNIKYYSLQSHNIFSFSSSKVNHADLRVKRVWRKNVEFSILGMKWQLGKLLKNIYQFTFLRVWVNCLSQDSRWSLADLREMFKAINGGHFNVLRKIKIKIKMLLVFIFFNSLTVFLCM